MNLDDVLWMMICGGFLLSIATLRAALREHQFHRALEDERLAERKMLWPKINAPSEPEAQGHPDVTVIAALQHTVQWRPSLHSSPAHRRYYVPSDLSAHHE